MKVDGTVAVAASILVHLGLVGALLWRSDGRQPPVIAVVDVDLAPVAPAAEALAPEEARKPDEPIAKPPETRNETPPDEPVMPEDGFGAADAGVADASVDAPVDAGSPDAARKVRVDAGAADAGEPDAGETLVATADGDGGLRDGGDGDGDAGAAVAVSGDGDAGVAADGGAAGDGGTQVATGEADPTGDVNAHPSSGTKANLIQYFPTGHVVSVLARLDRLRDTEWAAEIEAIMLPLPDRASLVGDPSIKVSDRFDLLAFSSSNPENVLDTTVVAHTRMAPSALRTFIDQAAPVAWSVVKGGALGKRLRSPRVLRGDRRVFLLWQRGWAVLADPADLGGALEPAPGALDQAAALPDSLPPWLARASSIEDESGRPDGPALMVTAAGLFAPTVAVPALGVSVPGPDAVTVTLELDPKGFVVRGNLRYKDDATAATAADRLQRIKAELLDDTARSFALRMAHAWNAVNGLSVLPTGRRVTFATSISTADGHALLTLTANLLAAHFEELQARPPKAPAAPPKPAPKP